MYPALDAVPILVLMPLTVVVALAAVEFGRWLGQRTRIPGAEPEGAVGASVGATLGMLAFVLAFTFSMSASRFDERKQIVIEDANAIGTTYLRAALLPEPAATQLRRVLREYVDLRLDAIVKGDRLEDMIPRSEQIHGELWERAVALANEQPTFTTIPLFIQALNGMIDSHGKRVAAVRNRMPPTIWAFMFVTTAIAMVSIGYQAGVSGGRRRAAIVCLAVAFAGVIMLIADLDRPQQGFLRVSQQPMLDLQRSMQADADAESP